MLAVFELAGSRLAGNNQVPRQKTPEVAFKNRKMPGGLSDLRKSKTIEPDNGKNKLLDRMGRNTKKLIPTQ